MAGPFLLVQTPRAGSKNHRFLASANSGLDEAQASQIVDRALQRLGDDTRAVGPDFLVVGRRGILQASGDRTGDEVLLLGGINTRKLRKKSQERALAQLEKRMAELKEVICSIDWDRSSRMLIEEERLGQWLQDDFASLPPDPRRRGTSWLLKSGIASAILAILCTIMVIGWMKGSPRPPSADSARNTARTTNRSDIPTCPADRFEMLLKEWGLEKKKAEAVQDLATIACPQEKQIEESRLFKDPKVARFLEEATKNSISPPCFLFFEEGDGGTLRRLGQRAGRLPYKKVIGIRQQLSLVARYIDEFREETKGSDLSSLAVDHYPYLRMARNLATNPLDSSQWKPVLPVFGRRDEATLKELPPFIDHALPIEVKKRIDWTDDQSLGDQLRLFRKHKEVLRAALGKDLDSILRDGEKEQKERIERLYAKFSALLGQLANDDVDDLLDGK